MPSPTQMSDRSTPYRDDLCRTAPFQLIRAESDAGDDGLTIEGYGAVFNSKTRIDSWEGSFDEVIAPGAFRKSLRERTPKMQFDHGQHPLLGSLPIGRWDTAEEDARGLHLVGRLTDNWLVQPFRDSIRDGGVEGMSFRFSVVRERWTDAEGKTVKDDDLGRLLWEPGDRGPLLRTLLEVRSSEAGPVTWPAYEDTAVGVRSLDGRRTVVIDLARLMNAHPDERARLAKLVAVADRATSDHPSSGEVAPQTPDGSPSGASPASPEPRSTEAPADEHPTPQVAPPVTDASAGEHSSASPANPVERSADIKARFRRVTDRVLALPPSSQDKESA